MARRLGCKASLVTAFEQGEQTPDSDTIHQYQSLFNIHRDQRRQTRLRPLADSIIQEQKLQQIDTDKVE